MASQTTVLKTHEKLNEYFPPAPPPEQLFFQALHHDFRCGKGRQAFFMR